MTRARWFPAAAALAMVAALGCAARRPPLSAPAAGPTPAAAEAPAAATPPAEATSPAGATPPAPETAPADETAQSSRPRLRELCRQEAGEQTLVDDTRRVLQETFCGATLWFDGLFGGEPDVENARQVSGRVELSTLHTQAEGTDFKGRLRLRYDLPTLERRVNVFFGRDDRDEFVEGRSEGFAIRSSVFGLESEDQWLAGLGYSPPGRWARKLDFRVGGRVKSAPEVFVQGRYRRNIFLGTHSVWRWRETVFWENRDGFGLTSSLDFDRVLRHDYLFRWGNVGTVAEATDGLAWRSALIVYHNLRRARAVAGDVFVRGESAAPVRLREYGVRAIYRQPAGRPFLFGELVVGYTWPRFEPEQSREGSVMVGLGLELLFGREPF